MQAIRLGEDVGGDVPVLNEAVCLLVDTLLARGHVDRAAAFAEEYAFAPPYSTTMLVPDAACVRGRLLLALGRTEEAVAELGSTGRALTGRGRHSVVVGPWALDLAGALADRHPERAAELAGYARREAERLGTRSAVGLALLCAAALTDGAERITLLERAVQHLEPSPCADVRARAWIAYGIEAGDTAHLATGLELAQRCGADGLAERALRALEAGRLRHSPHR
jgi:hypothetical protein